MFKNEETGMLSMGKFLSALRTTGLRKTDPRLKEMMDNLKKMQKNADNSSIDTQKLDEETFSSIVSQNIGLISRAFRHQFIIPEFETFSKEIEEIYWKCKSNTEGKVASYIPQLARTNPDYWGVSICTVDGQRFSLGDVNINLAKMLCITMLARSPAEEILTN
uniref:glutaminase n=1 Tax=Photinus pyralis TaxID=7054 RepID=A0A1Y1N9S3_PHOPY